MLAKGRREAMMLAYERNTEEKRSAPRLDIICQSQPQALSKSVG